ncbi:hypothetical protein [Burkholderia sp. Nafp2/4-1b]|uniref:hypothetical protein n=1 Tax=Burkholderia sp. Nafp2/4-1b TaxID=2116686 RepID=UPI0013CEDD78|nr:hypothetical protein [Burkholderia sp. Nafp2/4-1b]
MLLLPLAQKATVALGGAGARYDAPAVRDSLARFAAGADGSDGSAGSADNTAQP